MPKFRHFRHYLQKTGPGGGQSPAHWAGEIFFGREFLFLSVFGSEKVYLFCQKSNFSPNGSDFFEK